MEADGESLGDHIPKGTGGMHNNTSMTSNPSLSGEGEQTSGQASLLGRICSLCREGKTCSTRVTRGE